MLSRRTFLMSTTAMLVSGYAGTLKAGFSGTPTLPTLMLDDADPTRIIRHYQMPDVPLVDQDGRPAYLRDELQREGPVLMNFIFTTCPGICPVLSATFARTAELLGEHLKRTRLWSISVDPDYDTPKRLSKYRDQFKADEQWQFFTGGSTAVKSIRNAFDTDSDNKMAHQMLVLLRLQNDTWMRFEGEIEAESLAAEIRNKLTRR